MKKHKLLALIACLLILTVALCACGDKDSDPTDAPQQTDGGDGAPVLSTSTELYYNIYRSEYEGKAEDSLTSRSKDLTDGYFHIEMSSCEQVLEVLAKSRILTNKIDTNSVLYLTFKEDNIVDEAFTLADLGGVVAANKCFVTTVEGSVVTLNTNNTNSGDVLTIDLADGVNIVDISDPDDEGYGKTTTLAEMDELYAVADTSGNVTHIWVLSRAGQNLGRGGCICGANEAGPHKEGCDGTILYYWKPWTNKTSMPSEGGYWYLDVEGGVIELDERVWIKSNVEIYLDLNGHTVYTPTASGHSVYYCSDKALKFNLTVLDSVGNGTFKVRNVEDATSVQARFLIYNGPKQSATFYGGTVDGSAVTTTQSGGNGGLFRIINGATLNIHGGTFIGTQGYSNTGNVIFCSGTLNITGGTITGGKAVKGGNIFMGTYDDNGTTIYSTFNMTGGEILNGIATNSGGNLCYYEDGTFTHTGGTISGGTINGDATPKDADIYMYPKFDPAA